VLGSVQIGDREMNLDTFTYEEKLGLRDWLISHKPHARIEDEYELHRFLFNQEDKYKKLDASIPETYRIGTKDGIYIKYCIELPFEKVPLLMGYDYPLVPLIAQYRLRVGK
jgi:hypothetical protein